MCRHPAYESYCKLMAGQDDKRIKEIKESSELNNN